MNAYPDDMPEYRGQIDLRTFDEIVAAAGDPEFPDDNRFDPEDVPRPKRGRPKKERDPDLMVRDDAAIEACVVEFNRRYMVVNEQGVALVYEPGFDELLKRRFYTRLRFEDLHKLYLPRKIQVGISEKTDKPVMKTMSQIWLEHPDRREYIGGVTFDPSMVNARADQLNLWQGYAVEAQEGDWSRFKGHIRKIICDDDQERFDYLMGWMARMIQFPGEPGEVAVVMRGGEGTGKGTLAKVLLRILGHHGMTISNSKHLVGNFNAHLRDAIFLFADEAFFAGDKAHVGALKALITEPYITIEAKYQNAVQSPNFLHIMMASNEEWVVPASQDARRFFVLEVSGAAKAEFGYFDDLHEELNSGGYEAMRYELEHYDLSNFNVRSVPVTQGLQEQKKLTLRCPERWWLDCLMRGYIYRSKIGLSATFNHWHDEVATDLLVLSYEEFWRGSKERDKMSREQLGLFMRSMGASPKRPRRAIAGEEIAEAVNEWGSAVRKAQPIIGHYYGFHFGSLENARDAFIAATGIAFDWDADANTAVDMRPANQQPNYAHSLEMPRFE